ncbi:MAG: ABC-F family ATP-binding cassette domain-containing protein [Actinomycetota bacterium]
MIRVSKLNKAFGSRDLFIDAELNIGARDRIALVGPNGSGKTTLFEILVGSGSADSGDVQIAGDAVIGYLSQETDDLRGKLLLEEVMSAGSASDLGHRIRLLEDEMTVVRKGPELDRLVADYSKLEHRFANLGGYNLEHEAKAILGGLGFKTDDLGRGTETFSGGWLMRIALAKLLLSSPDLLLLDEPTNHLDLESVEWLERFLRSYEGAIVLISHDRDLINGFASKVVEVSACKLDMYTGDFEDFIRQRELAMHQAEAAARNQARKVAQTQVFIDRFRYKASKAKQVQSRIKSLDRMERAESPKQRRRAVNLRFPEPERAGRVVLELRDMSFGYSDELVYRSLDLVIERDHKIALVGPNGAGKTTLLKLVAGALTPRSGEVVLGHNARIAYFAQHQIEALDPAKRVIEEMLSAMPKGATMRPRDLLGRLLFSGDDVDKPVSVLSGGERSRLALGKLLVSRSNLLCLDEPTNHLDMESRDVLEDSLNDYQGAMVLITHDRHLIRSVANRIIEVVAGRVSVFDGDYEYYVAKREEVVTDDVVRGPQMSSKDRRREQAQTRARLKELVDKVRRLETQVELAAQEIKVISKTLADPEFYTSGADVSEMVKLYDDKSQRLTDLEKLWESAASDLESHRGLERTMETSGP